MTWHPLCLALAIIAATAVPARAATYYVSAAGSDANTGASPRASWRTLARVSTAALQPGDRVLFRRGDQWRGQLRPRSGSPAGVILYGAYGKGPKPVFLGSVSKSRPSDWSDEGGNIWSAGAPAADAPATLPPAATAALPWHLYTEGTARAAGAPDSDLTSFRVDCADPGTAGYHIQLFRLPFHVELGKVYRLVFRARATQPFRQPLPQLMQAGPPWASYTSGNATRTVVLGPEWQTYSQLYESGVTADDARLTFFLGGALPAGATLQLDSLSFTEYPAGEAGGALPMDVGNLLFDGGASCGVKRWHEADLQHQDDFWYDGDRQVVKVYAIGNPAARHHSIECALTRHLVDESGASYVTYENLDLRYAGAHGVGGGNTHDITVRDCDISYIGGGFMQLEGRPVRYGNGIEFWGPAHDNLVERCRLWEIYDAALTNQNTDEIVVQANLTYRDNTIWNSEYSFEFWNRPEASRSEHIRFEHNTCVSAGHGWGHRQRPDPGGRQLCLYYNSAQMKDIVIRDNIFAGATDNALYAPNYQPARLAQLGLGHNLWFQPAGAMVLLESASYDMVHFADYQKELGVDAGSVTAPPRFVNAAQHDYRLAPGSPGAGLGRRQSGTRGVE